MRLFALASLAILSGFLCTSCQLAYAASPSFEDYQVDPVKIAHPAKLKLTDAKSQQYATMLREASRKKPNFAGHYVLASWGCGASCIMAAAIDATDGHVIWLPFTVCCWPLNVTEPLEFKKNSRLLIVHGSRNEQASGTDSYDFDGLEFKSIGSADK